MASDAWRMMPVHPASDLSEDIDDRFPTLVARCAREGRAAAVAMAGDLAEALARHLATAEAPDVSVRAGMQGRARTREAIRTPDREPLTRAVPTAAQNNEICSPNCPGSTTGCPSRIANSRTVCGEWPEKWLLM